MESTAQYKAIGNQLLSHIIASYLTPPDLAKCLRLCRFWHNEFEPYFFRKLTIKYLCSLSHLMTNIDAVKALRQNMHHVREIDCTDENISRLFSNHPLPNLTRLRTMTFKNYETTLVPFLRGSPRIHTLGLVLGYSNQQLKLLNMLNDITHYLPSLRCLDLDCKGWLDQGALAQVLCFAAGLEIVRLEMNIGFKDKIWTSLPGAAAAAASSSPGGDIVGMDPQRTLLKTFSEIIALKATRSRTHDDDDDDDESSSLSLPVKEFRFSSLTKYSLKDDPFLDTFLRYCHRLEKLAFPDIRENENDFSAPTFYLDLLSACLNTLQYLDVFECHASGEAIATVIQKCVNLRGFRWGCKQRNSELVYSALVAHHRTSLEEIDVSGIYYYPFAFGALAPEFLVGDLFHKILYSFPHLRHFEALSAVHPSYKDHCISSIDFKDPSGCFTNWVCKDLESMSIRLVPGIVYRRHMGQTGIIYDNALYRRAPIFPEVLCTQLCRLKKLKELRVALQFDPGLGLWQQLQREKEDNCDPHMSMGEAFSKFQGTLKNLRTLELRNMGKLIVESELDVHPLMDVVFMEEY
ncbi:hypothetical protein BG004_006212 [Podila humilis]|nr:hypothetical protein BG004_006212 [Podila humilis]